MSLNGLTLTFGWCETEGTPGLDTSITTDSVVIGSNVEVVKDQLSWDINGDVVTFANAATNPLVDYNRFMGGIFFDTEGVLPDIGGMTILANDFDLGLGDSVLNADMIGMNITGLWTPFNNSKLQFRIELTPSDIVLSTQSIAENSAGGVVGDIDVTDLNDADIHTFEIDDARFEIVAGQLKLKTGIALNFETESSIDVTVTATDSFGLKFEEVLTIGVDNVNEGALGADKTIETKEDRTYRFTEADFGFSDTDGDALAAVVVDSLPGSGKLKLHGVALTAGQSIAAADIASLSWRPDKNANGDALASFTFTVVDDGGTDHGGTDADAAARTITFNVADVGERLNGNFGNNIIRGTAGDDFLHGKAGNDVLKGLDGADKLRSIKGDDKLWGGAGADTFVYSTGSGKDTIMDFESGADRIDVRKWAAIDSFADIKAHAKDMGGDLWIGAGRDTLVISDFSKGELDRHDFLI